VQNFFNYQCDFRQTNVSGNLFRFKILDLLNLLIHVSRVPKRERGNCLMEWDPYWTECVCSRPSSSVVALARNEDSLNFSNK